MITYVYITIFRQLILTYVIGVFIHLFHGVDAISSSDIDIGVGFFAKIGPEAVYRSPF